MSAVEANLQPDGSITTEASKPVLQLVDPSPAAEPVEDETRNDAPTNDDESARENDNISITANTTTAVISEDSLVGVNKCGDIQEADTNANLNLSLGEKLTASLIVVGAEMRNKTIEITNGMATWVVSVWKGQAAALREIREDPDGLKQKFNDFLESMKFTIQDNKSLANTGAFNDDDSFMKANADIEVMLAESDGFESNKNECWVFRKYN